MTAAETNIRPSTGSISPPASFAILLRVLAMPPPGTTLSTFCPSELFATLSAAPITALPTRVPATKSAARYAKYIACAAASALSPMFLNVMIGLTVSPAPVELDPIMPFSAPPRIHWPTEILPVEEVGRMPCFCALATPTAASRPARSSRVVEGMSSSSGMFSNVTTGSSISFIASPTSAYTLYQIPRVIQPPSFMRCVS